MPPHLSEACHIAAVEGAGRGVVASRPLQDGLEVFLCADTAAHVIFREYRKEVCAECFHYDRGRTLPVRANDTGKVFCSKRCHDQWKDQTGEVGVEAWQILSTYVNANSKHISAPTAVDLEGPRPSAITIADAWRAITASTETKTGRQLKEATSPARHIDPDVLGFFLSAILTHSHEHAIWHDAMALVLDDTPHKSQYELSLHSRSFQQIQQLLPSELQASCTPEICRDIVRAASHNAFGIRSGGEDAEEYMGYAVYPLASYFNHSCEPNVGKKRLGRAWQFFCIRNVTAGEQLCISYLGGDEKDLKLSDRRKRLEDTWGFVCQCVRCTSEASQ